MWSVRFQAIFLSLGIFLSSFTLGAQESDRQLEDRLRERYEDFYTRLNDLQKRPYETEAARREQQRVRKQYEEQRDKARVTYVKSRKQKPKISDELHEREIAARKKALEEQRRKYVQQKQRFLNVERKSPEVPEWVEYRLYEDTLVSDSPAKSSN